MSNTLQNDDECIAAWKGFTSRFNKLVDGNPAPEKIKGELLKLKEEVAIKNSLNYRQTQALLSRIESYQKGEYGNSKRAEHYLQSKPSSSKS